MTTDMRIQCVATKYGGSKVGKKARQHCAVVNTAHDDRTELVGLILLHAQLLHYCAAEFRGSKTHGLACEPGLPGLPIGLLESL